MRTLGFLFASMIFTALIAINAEIAQAQGRFDHCSRPVAPGCVDNLAAYKNKQALKTCSDQMDRYKAMTFAYRQCMSKQLEYEIFRINRSLAKFRCLRKTHGQMTNTCRRLFQTPLPGN